MTGRTLRQRRNIGRAGVRGFTLLEMLFTVVIGIILTTIAVPLTTNAMSYFKLRSAVSSVTGAVQSGHNQAIFQGCPFQVVFTAATGSFQVQNEVAPAGTNTCAATFANNCAGGAAACPVPFAAPGSGITLNADTTITFFPGGSTQSTNSVAGITSMILTQGNKTATINVSAFGNVNVQYAP